VAARWSDAQRAIAGSGYDCFTAMASVNAAGSFYASSDHLQSQKFI
jgi:hypothetical protein